MTDTEKHVWAAIEDALYKVGDVDMRAGLSWIDEDGKARVVRAAIAALLPPPWADAENEIDTSNKDAS